MRLRAALVAVLLSTSCSGGGSGSSSPPPPPPPVGQPVTLTGTVTYDFVPSVYVPAADTGTLRFDLAQQRPVRFAKVQVSQGTTVLAVESTDAAGHYSITFTPVSSETPIVAALAETAPPAPSIRVQDNTDANKVWAVGANVASGVTTIDLHATHGWTGSAYGSNRIAAPFAILDSMYTAEKRIVDVRSQAVFPDLKVNWSPNNVPQAGDVAQGDIVTSHYNSGTNQIYILGKDGVDTDEFDAHVIVHEWGHFFEDNLSRSDSIGGSHTTGDVLDPRLAFGEGYGNAIAAMLLPESIYSDTFWNQAGAIVGFGFDAETVPSPSDDFASAPFTGMSPGPFSEFSILRILYDLYDDSGNAESWDHVALGLGPIYDTLVGPERTTPALTTLASFIAGLKSLVDAPTAAAIDALLAERGIGQITDAFGTGDPKLSAMYQQVAPSSATTVNLDGRAAENQAPQNRYLVFQPTSASTRVQTSSSQDVDIFVYRNGVLLGFGAGPTGTESITVPTTPGVTHVAVLQGFGQVNGTYPATVTISAQ